MVARALSLTNTSFDPSGDHDGSRPPVSVVTPPSARAISATDSFFVKAIRLPSGLHAGSDSDAALLVRRTNPVPSLLTTQRSEVPGTTTQVNAIR